VFYYACTCTATTSTTGAGGQTTFVNTGVPIIASVAGAITTVALGAIIGYIAYLYKQSKKRKYAFSFLW